MNIFKILRNLLARRVKVEDVVSQDIIIVVIGPTGAGKSSFINKATRASEAPVNHGLASCTGEVECIKCTYPGDEQGRSVVFVDTPAFNHDIQTDSEIGKQILRWITKTYDRKNTVAGILYMHRISDQRMTELPLSHLRLFQQSCGGYLPPQRVVLATTMWGNVNQARADSREKEIRDKYWKTMLDMGSPVVRFDNTVESAWRIVNMLLGKDGDIVKVGSVATLV